MPKIADWNEFEGFEDHNGIERKLNKRYGQIYLQT